jgi:predicted enzyme related to lactoylglutathione lyase
MITFVVDNCGVSLRAALKHGARVIEEPQNMPYGQRRALVYDLAGTIVDISSPV